MPPPVSPSFFTKHEVDITITLYFRVRVLEGPGRFPTDIHRLPDAGQPEQ
jgi:hypothetical protein